MFNRRIGLIQGLAIALGAAPFFSPQFKARLEKRDRPHAATGAAASARRRWLNRWAPEGGGARERARRRRQIAAGTLNTSSGLVPFITD